MRPTITKEALFTAFEDYKKWLSMVDDAMETRKKGAHAEGNPVLCSGQGCNHCCKIPVTITCMEGLLIAKHLRETERDTPQLRDDLYRRAEVMNQYANGDNGKARDFYKLGVQCAFIDNYGSCSIYTERPAICRLCTSLRPPEVCQESADEKLQILQTADIRSKLEGLAQHHGNVIGCAAAWTLPEMVLWGLMEFDILEMLP